MNETIIRDMSINKMKKNTFISSKMGFGIETFSALKQMKSDSHWTNSLSIDTSTLLSFSPTLKMCIVHIW